MEKTIKELMEDIWHSYGCRRPLWLCRWHLNLFGDHIYLKDKLSSKENNNEKD